MLPLSGIGQHPAVLAAEQWIAKHGANIIKEYVELLSGELQSKLSKILN